METWPFGVFAGVDAGLGVSLEVARDLGVRTVQLHTPHQASACGPPSSSAASRARATPTSPP
jgi:hypothetical protein